MTKGINQYFRIQVNATATVFVALICAICIISRDTTSPVLLGLLLTYSMSIQYNLSVLLMVHMFIEKLMVSADRCMQMTKVVQEEFSDEMLKDRPEWPEKGCIEFQEVDLKYRPDTEGKKQRQLAMGR